MPEVIRTSTVATDGYLAAARGRFPDPSNCRYLNRSATVYKPDGSMLLAFRRRAVLAADWRLAFDAVRRGARKTDPMFGRKLAAGGQSEFYSGTLGRMSGNLTYPTRDDPKGWERMRPLIRSLDAVFRSECPKEYAIQRELVRDIDPGYFVPGTPFTTVTANRSAQTAYHPDEGNVPGSFGVLSFEGSYSGGLLVFPKYRVALNLRPLDVLIADNLELHGNTEIWGHRLSIVCYAHTSNII